MSRTPETTDRLRTEIDRGKGGDKVPYSDPAAAPLGTDDEAGGTSPTRSQVRTAANQELGGDSSKAPGVANEETAAMAKPQTRIFFQTFLTIIAVTAAIAIGAYVIFGLVA